MQTLFLILLLWVGIMLAGWLLYAVARGCAAISDFFFNPTRNLPK